MLTKQPRITQIPGRNPVPGRPGYTVCRPATPGGGSGGGIGGGGNGGNQVCKIVCRPREDLGMGGTTTVCTETCYWSS